MQKFAALLQKLHNMFSSLENILWSSAQGSKWSQKFSFTHPMWEQIIFPLFCHLGEDSEARWQMRVKIYSSHVGKYIVRTKIFGPVHHLVLENIFLKELRKIIINFSNYSNQKVYVLLLYSLDLKDWVKKESYWT